MTGADTAEEHIIELDDITVDETVQVRDKTHASTVHQYAHAIQAYTKDDDPVARGFPPVRVEEYEREGGARGYWLVGGFHRVSAARKMGKTKIPAVVEPESSREARRWKATSDNLTHGRKLTRKERIAGLKAYIAANEHRQLGPRGGRANQPFKPIAEMQRDLGGIKYETLRKWMWQHANPTYKQVFQGDGGNQEDQADAEWAIDPEQLRERRDKEETDKAIRLVRGLVRSLQNSPNLWDVRDQLLAIVQEIDDRAGPHPQDF